MYVFSTSLTKGRLSGFKVSLGLCSGLWVHTLLVILGVGNFLNQYPESQRILEFLGGAYLLFLAVKSWSSVRRIAKRKHSPKSKSENHFLTGFVMNLSNPKVSLFFISFFPGFLFHQSWSFQWQFLILGMIFFVQALLVFSSVTFFADQIGTRFLHTKDSTLWNRIQAIVLALIALMLFYP
jgi:threonine/homoserine/homoserine lactone efflux protein